MARKPMTPQEKKAFAERMKAARAAKGSFKTNNSANSAPGGGSRTPIRPAVKQMVKKARKGRKAAKAMPIQQGNAGVNY